MLDPLAVDLYADDLNGKPDLNAIAKAGYPWCVLSMKVSQGMYYSSGNWLKTYWTMAKTCWGTRYGDSGFRQAYHYGDLTGRSSVKQQYDFFGAQVKAAGGWDDGDLPIGLDIEQASNPTGIGKAKLEDFMNAFDALALADTGQHCIVYGGSYLRENNAHVPAGCAPWVALYGDTLPSHVVTDLGVASVYDAFGWQYSGTDPQTKFPKGYPTVSPAGHTDLTEIFIRGGKDNAMQWMREHRIVPHPRP